MRFTSPAEKRWFDDALDHWQRRVEGAERDVLARILYQRYAETKAQLLHKAGFDPDQPRDDHGRWTDGDEGAGGSAAFGEAPDGTPIEAAGDRNGPKVINRHIRDRHINISDKELMARVDASQTRSWFYSAGLQREGSFSSEENARTFISETLKENEIVVARVQSGVDADAFLVKRFGYLTGREAVIEPIGSETRIRGTYMVGVSIVHDPMSRFGYRVVTAYPRNYNSRIGQ